MSAYAQLHCVSNFSFLRGASHPGELVEQAHRLGYSAIALTDECSMAGVVRAHEAARDCGMKLIVGAEFRTSNGMHMVLLAPSQSAYSQICHLITCARRQAPKGHYRLSNAQMQTGLDECLALWMAPASALISQAAWVQRHFPDRAWIAVELHRQADDEEYLARLQALATRSNLPLVASSDVHMHISQRRALQDTLTAIRHGCTLAEAGHRLFPNGERYLRPIAELEQLYPQPLLEQSVRIADRCEFSLDSLRYSYPGELVPEGSTASEHLRNLVEIGIRRRWPSGIQHRHRQLIEKELELIARLAYEHFFLTVHELVDWARSQTPPIACQGRGSAANSVVCYTLGITDVNPDHIKMLFERFLSEERDEPPDIDVDFEHERREEVIQHVFEKYGRERAAIAATVITYRRRSAIRDVGKALGLQPQLLEHLSKAQLWWDGWERFSANITALGLTIESAQVQRLFELVQQVLHFPRHLSQHVGGFVIAEQPISMLVPIENAAMEGRTIIQWDKNDLESLGLLKVDVLALGMLTALRKTFQMLQATGGPGDMSQIPDDDKATYDMICRADTIGVFQIESRAQMSMLPRLQPRDYYDLVIEIAIVRPGPIKGGMVHPYLQRRRLPDDQIPYASDALRPVLHKTRGVPIFQEQVMQIAVVAAGFTPGEADQLRRTMGAWQRSGKMGLYREKLLRGMHERGYSPQFAEQIYQQIEGFGEYGFPESHSASFALLTYGSSYLKHHHPAAFFAGLINSQPMGFYQPSQLLEQAKRQDVRILPVDVCHSDYDCTLEPHDARHAIRLGLRLVKSLSAAQAGQIIAARMTGAFTSIADFSNRTALPKRCLQQLAQSGALRSLSEHRNQALWQTLATERLPGLFQGMQIAESTVPELPAPAEIERIRRDYQALGLSTGRHPLALLRTQLRDMGIASRQELGALKSGRRVRVCGLITHLQHPQTANGVVFASLEDETGIHNIIFWPAVFDAHRHPILTARMLMVSGELQNQEGVVNVIAQTAQDCSALFAGLPRKSRDFH